MAPGISQAELRGELDTFAKLLRQSIREDFRRDLKLQLDGNGPPLDDFLAIPESPKVRDRSRTSSWEKEKGARDVGRISRPERSSLHMKPRVSKSFEPEVKASRTSALEDAPADGPMLSSRELDYTLLPQQVQTQDTDQSPFPGPSPRHLDHHHRFGILRRTARSIVHSTAFEVIAILLVLMNCIELGIESDACAKGQAFPMAASIELAFCVGFSTELTLRLFASGLFEYFSGEHWQANCFDFSVVAVQVIDQCLRLLPKSMQTDDQGLGVESLRLLRLLRLFRILRLVRVVHMVQDLKTIASAMVSAFSALIWTMMLLFMLMYIWSILCMEVITRAEQTRELTHHKELKYFFGSLGRSMLTLFECIVGGISWDEIASPLSVDISPWMGVAVIVYIIITCYAVTNMMTGMFVQKAMQFATENQDRAQAEVLRDLCFQPDEETGNVEEIDEAKFEEMAKTPEMLNYFKSLNVDASEAQRLFDLLDADGGGTLAAEELVAGCLRLRGASKAIDLCLLMKQTTQIQTHIDEIWDKICNRDSQVAP